MSEKMFGSQTSAKNGNLQRGVIAGKFQGQEAANGYQFLNRTGPIKISHNKTKFMTGPPRQPLASNSQQQSQQNVEDIFNVNEDNPTKDPNKKFKSG